MYSVEQGHWWKGKCIRHQIDFGHDRSSRKCSTGNFVTLINGIDRDSAENGQFQCDIPKNTPFSLRTSPTNHYELITNEPLDREALAEYEINAREFGSISLSRNKPIMITIADVNDNAPQFAELFYSRYVMENTAPCASIFTVTATDPELNQNVHVSCSFQEGLIQDFPVSSYLSIK